jgi:hypothetical protein
MSKGYLRWVSAEENSCRQFILGRKWPFFVNGRVPTKGTVLQFLIHLGNLGLAPFTRKRIMDLESLTELQRRTLVLIKCYEDCRRKFHFGYQALDKALTNEEILDSNMFKTFATITSWLMGKNWTVTSNLVHWSGFIQYVFDSMAPMIPQPAQIKNPVLFKKYCLSRPKVEAEAPSFGRLVSIYNRALRPELAYDFSAKKLLGLEGLDEERIAGPKGSLS